jgi:hypothetical protein
VQFIAALRTAGVRISLAESADAFRAVESLGVQARQTFQYLLRSTLIKENRDYPAFEELFPLFFDTAENPPLTDLSSDLTPDEAGAFAEILQQLKEKIQRLLDRLLNGDPLSKSELEHLAELSGLNNANDLRYRAWMSQRMQRALGIPEMREALRLMQELLEKLGVDPERAQQLRQKLQENLQSLAEQVEQFAGQQIAEQMSRLPPETSKDQLFNRPFETLSDKEMDDLRKEVRRLAAALRTKMALRLKRAKTGSLDAKATIRANLKHGSVPIEIRHRDRTLKPKVVVICDISTSMRPCSELMLSLLYALQDQISKTHAFAFIDHLEYISPDFQRQDSQSAVQQVLRRMPPGHYNTDLGYSLSNLSRDYANTLDSQTVFIVVGDGRNNFRDPGLDHLTRIVRRSRRTIWLNPEPESMWGTGDSDMLRYAPLCDAILKVSTFSELASAVDLLLTN